MIFRFRYTVSAFRAVPPPLAGRGGTLCGTAYSVKLLFQQCTTSPATVWFDYQYKIIGLPDQKAVEPILHFVLSQPEDFG